MLTTVGKPDEDTSHLLGNDNKPRRQLEYIAVAFAIMCTSPPPLGVLYSILITRCCAPAVCLILLTIIRYVHYSRAKRARNLQESHLRLGGYDYDSEDGFQYCYTDRDSGGNHVYGSGQDLQYYYSWADRVSEDDQVYEPAVPSYAPPPYGRVCRFVTVSFSSFG